jgi:hypothetical protein
LEREHGCNKPVTNGGRKGKKMLEKFPVQTLAFLEPLGFMVDNCLDLSPKVGEGPNYLLK